MHLLLACSRTNHDHNLLCNVSKGIASTLLVHSYEDAKHHLCSCKEL